MLVLAYIIFLIYQEWKEWANWQTPRKKLGCSRKKCMTSHAIFFLVMSYWPKNSRTSSTTTSTETLTKFTAASFGIEAESWCQCSKGIICLPSERRRYALKDWAFVLQPTIGLLLLDSWTPTSFGISNLICFQKVLSLIYFFLPVNLNKIDWQVF